MRALTSLLLTLLCGCAETTRAPDEPAPPPPFASAPGIGMEASAGSAGIAVDNPAPPLPTAADEGVQSPPPEAALPGPICDGSDRMRLGITGGGGFVPSWYAFAYPFGAFVFVDGKCRYYASSNYMRGVHQGTLSDAEAAELADAIGFPWIVAWGSSNDQNCDDGGTVTIMRPEGSASCYCGCDPLRTPEEMKLAIENAGKRISELAKGGTALDGDLAAAAEAVSVVGGTPLPWPLSRPVASIEDLVEPMVTWVGAGTRFTDPAETALLRTLRADSITAGNTWAAEVEESGVVYDVYLRDALPDDVALAIEILRSGPPLGGP